MAMGGGGGRRLLAEEVCRDSELNEQLHGLQHLQASDEEIGRLLSHIEEH